MTSTEYPKRLIEVDLPIKEISAHARREKSIRHGHISTLHIWWARRPLAACRAVLCASLWPDPADENCPQEFREHAANTLIAFAENVRTNKKLAELCQKGWTRWKRTSSETLNADNPGHWGEIRYALLDFIADFANWDASTIPEFLETSRSLTKHAHKALGGIPQTKPLVFDPFAGGGAIPFEALRVGADTFASDLNPIALLLNKVLIEYIPRYGSKLPEQVNKWGQWVKKEAINKLSCYYPNETDDSMLIGYLWARTIKCEGPRCGVRIPIIKNQIISSRKGSEASISIEYHNNELRTKVITGPKALKINGGTSKRSSVTCQACGFTTPRQRVAVQANKNGFGYHLLAVCLRDLNGKRIYRQPQLKDFQILELVDKELNNWQDIKFNDIPSIPIEELPYLRSIFNVRVYGIDKWSKLFHRRQLLSSLVFTSLVRKAAAKIKETISDSDFSASVIECLALSVSSAFQYQCNIATYLTEGIKSAFIQGQSLPMKMDFIEANPIMDELAGGYSYSLSQHVSGLNYASSFQYDEGTTQQVSALGDILPENSVDILATDPPYYDVVPYADCSDFFYVWLRRMLHGITNFPTISNLTPKNEEIVQLAERNERYRERTKGWFEDKMRESLSKARVSMKSSGIAMIIFAHKETTAWEALLQSVLDAGWIITGSWPIDTEKGSRLRANDSAVLGSSIHIVCRSREYSMDSHYSENIGDWRHILQELPKRIHDWMPRLQQEGVVGADAIFSCLGPALEIFSRYSRVEKASGDVVTLREYLEHVWAAVAKEALTMIFKDADSTGYEEDARLTAMWLWTISTGGNGNGKKEGESEKNTGYILEYDAARKIAQGLGAHLEKLNHLVEIKGDKARLLPVVERTRHLFGKENPLSQKKQKKRIDQIALFETLNEIDQDHNWNIEGVPKTGETTLDKVHQSMFLFATGRGEALKRFLVEEGAGKDSRFWQLAQALSALYPSHTDEKRWVDGVLARKKSLGF